MGVWIDLFVGPKSGKPLARDAFEALLVDLIRERIVTRPCALVAGKLEPNQPLAVANFVELGIGATGEGDPLLDAIAALDKDLAADLCVRDCEMLYRGERSAELFAALRAAPFGKKDLCVWFAGLDWENGAIREALELEGHANGAVIVYALAKRRRIALIDEEDERVLNLSCCFALTGKGCPTDVAGTPIEPVLKRHFGDPLETGVSYS